MTTDIAETVTIAVRVAAGAALLDERKPGWWQQVETVQLETQSSSCCVLGQVFGRYSAGRRALGSSSLMGMDDHETVARGFAVTGDEGPVWKPETAEYALLDAEWKRVISERQAALAATRTETSA